MMDRTTGSESRSSSLSQLVGNREVSQSQVMQFNRSIAAVDDHVRRGAETEELDEEDFVTSDMDCDLEGALLS